MGEPAKQLPPTDEKPFELPPLPKGDTELEHLDFAHQIRFTDRLGSSLQVGMGYNSRSISGMIVRLAMKSNGVAYILVRVGGSYDKTGLIPYGGRVREILIFSNGMYGAVPEAK